MVIRRRQELKLTSAYDCIFFSRHFYSIIVNLLNNILSWASTHICMMFLTCSIFCMHNLSRKFGTDIQQAMVMEIDLYRDACVNLLWYLYIFKVLSWFLWLQYNVSKINFQHVWLIFEYFEILLSLVICWNKMVDSCRPEPFKTVKLAEMGRTILQFLRCVNV